MTSGTLALRPIGYKFIGGKQISFYSVDPEVERIMTTVRNGTAARMIDHIWALRRIRTEARLKALKKAAVG